MSEKSVVTLKGVSKKYCRTIKRSMIYGLQDVVLETFGGEVPTGRLRRDEFWAIEDVSFEVRKGECLGLLGINGAGKSTLLKVVNGIIPPDKGQVTIRGRVGALIEIGAGFHPMLTGRENIYVNGAILGMRKREIERKLEQIVTFAELEEFIDTPVKFYSTGMYMRLGFAVAAHLDPDILLIDEVLAVGDVAFRLKCFNHIRGLIDKGVAVILVTHNLSELVRVCNSGFVLHRGLQLCRSSLDEAIRTYQNITLTLASNRAPNESRNEKVKIGSVKILNLEGIETNKFRSGSDMLLEINYQSEISVDNSIFLIKLVSQEIGPFVSFTNLVNGEVVPVSLGGGRVYVRLYNLPLTAGNYTIEVHLYDEKMVEFWDQAIPACSFDITEPMPDVWKEYHPVRIKHDWLLR